VVVRPLSHSVLVPTEEVITVLTGTVRENVAMEISPEFIDNSLVGETLEQAQLSTFLQESQEGIGTVAGGTVLALSGGQRRRLEMPRALYRWPTLLVLDEARYGI